MNALNKMADSMADDHGKRPRLSQIDENLRRVYEETLNEEIPDRFRRLLDQLRTAQAGTPADPAPDAPSAESDGKGAP